MNDLETLRKCEWNEIKVGEVFAYKGCWAIFCKIDDTTGQLLQSDCENMFEDCIGHYYKFENLEKRYVSKEIGTTCISTEPLFGNVSASRCIYKLSLSVQRLWRVD